MPWSSFKHKGQRLEMRDSRLEDIIDFCARVLPAFLEKEGGKEQDAWLNDLMKEWKEERQLPPGCKILRLDDWLVCDDRRDGLVRFLAFVASKVKSDLPATDAILATECNRVRDFILESTRKTDGGGDAPPNQQPP